MQLHIINAVLATWLCASYVLCSHAAATPFFYEPFDYPNDTRLAVQGNWTYGGSGTLNIHTNKTGSLAVGGLADPVGNKVLLGAGEPTAREVYTNCWNFGQASRGQTAYDLFCSFAVRVVGPFLPDAISTNCIALNQSNYQLVNFRRNANNASNFDIGISKNKTTNLVWDDNGGNGYLPNSNYFLVMSVDLDATTGTTANGLNLWIAPSASTFGQDNPPGPATLTTTCDSSDTRQKRFALCATMSPVECVYIDEVRMGTNWASVTPLMPEPAFAAAALLALLPLRKNCLRF